jgi:hypothetical protein
MIGSKVARRLAVLGALIAVIGALASPAMAGRGGDDRGGGGQSIQSFKGS